MKQSADAKPDQDWERTYAHKITRGQLTLVAVLYGLWIIFLGYLAFDRWFGGLY